MSEKLFEIRRNIKKKKPTFTRQDSHKKKRVGKKWRKPKGLQSKMRLRFKGYKRSVQTGYGSPRAVKGLEASGLKGVKICSISDLAVLDPGKHGAIIASSVGMRKKVDILKEAKQKKIKIINIKDPEKFLKDVEELFKKKIETKEEKAKEKKKKKEEKEKKAAEKEKEEKKEDKKEEKETIESLAKKEEKKVDEKKELDKTLTKKET